MKIVRRICKCTTVKNASGDLELVVTHQGEISNDYPAEEIEIPENKSISDVIHKKASEVNESNAKIKAIKLMSMPAAGMESTILLKYIQA